MPANLASHCLYDSYLCLCDQHLHCGNGLWVMGATSFKWVIFVGDTSAPKLPAKSRVYCCCLELWLPIAYVTLIFVCITNTCILDMSCQYPFQHFLINLVCCCCLQLWLPIACFTLIFACVTNTCITDMSCLLSLRHCLIKLHLLAVACNYGCILPVWLFSLPVWPTYALWTLGNGLWVQQASNETVFGGDIPMKVFAGGALWRRIVW